MDVRTDRRERTNSVINCLKKDRQKEKTARGYVELTKIFYKKKKERKDSIVDWENTLEFYLKSLHESQSEI